MTDLKWIFPSHGADEQTIRQFELDSIKDRTNFRPSDLETDIGLVNFFVFSPDRSMSATVDYTAFETWALDFTRVCAEGKMSERMGCLMVFELWNTTKKVGKATAFMPPLIASASAGLNLEPTDFIEQKRITIFCTPQPDHGLDLWALQTPRHANTP